MYSETIAAVATALSESGISIIRVSGDEAISIVDSIFISPSENHILKDCKSHTIHYGYIVDKNQIKIDEVLVSLMKGPKSFTAEDVVEINCHGGILVTQKILNQVLLSGARLAEPGEFTKRAFLNGRIDLTKAEAVMDLISSKSDYALKSSMAQLSGFLLKKIKGIREEIITELAFIEAALDDPEHYSLDDYSNRLFEKNKNWEAEIKLLIDSGNQGKYLRDGIATVIAGKPNAGKSSLMNLMLGEDKAIVTNIPGTTRDVLEDYVRIKGIGLRLSDTAGIHDTEDEVEKIGVDRALKNLNLADFVIFVLDGSSKLSEEDFRIYQLISDKKKVILINKNDQDLCFSKEDILEQFEITNDTPIISFSAVTGDGFSELSDTVENLFYNGELDQKYEFVVANSRHLELLQETLSSLYMVEESISMGMEEDFLSIDLMSAYSSLGKIIGEEVEDDLVNTIFAKFCMGK